MKLKIKKIEREINEVSQRPIHSLLQNSYIEFNRPISKNNINDNELLMYLVGNGYLDENYHHYISNFHEGRLTKDDRDYLLSIRNFNNPGPNKRINTPKEVCKNMRMEDFGSKYILNVILMDYLFENGEIMSDYIKSAMRYISQYFDQSKIFFTAYFISGNHLYEFFNSLSKEWPEFASAAISSNQGEECISHILRFVDSEYVSESMNKNNQLSNYLSKHGCSVLASDFQFPSDLHVLKKLHVCFHDLKSLEINKSLIKFVHRESLYAITPENVNYIITMFSSSEKNKIIDHESANYTSILSSGSGFIKEYIEKNLSLYVEKVFLSLPNNSKESESVIMILLNHEGIEDDLKEKIISKQEHIFLTFKGMPESVWLFLLLEEKIDISWRNISEYLNCEKADKTVVTELLTRKNIFDTLSVSKINIISSGGYENELLSDLVFNEDEIKDSDYCMLIKCLPYMYDDFPKKVSREKIACLANERTVRLTEDSFYYADDDNQLIAVLIRKNFDDYLEEKESYPISDEIRELLLSSELNNENKITICRDVTPSGVLENKKLSSMIASLLISNDIDYSEIDDVVLSSAIVNAQSSSDSIQLLVKCIPIWNEEKTMEVFADLPMPFSEISSYGKRPKLKSSKLNIELATLLKDKEFISTVKEEGSLIQINTFKSSDHSNGDM